jgi:hypothetical protein
MTARPADPIITALRLALAEVAARRAVEKAERRGKMTSVKGGRAVRRGLAEAFRAHDEVRVGARGFGPRPSGSSEGIWIPRLRRGRTLVTMGGALPPLRAVRSA